MYTSTAPGTMSSARHCRGSVESHMTHRAPRSLRMLHVPAIVNGRQHTQRRESPDRSPMHILDQAIAGVGARRDPHSPAGIGAVIKSEREAGAPVPLAIVIAANCKRERPQLRQ